jgi:hypothetical protein
MTIRAVDRLMGADQWESRVHESTVAPFRCRVAFLAVARPSQGGVIGTLRELEVCLVASGALDGGAQEVSNLGSGVTTETGHGCV